MEAANFRADAERRAKERAQQDRWIAEQRAQAGHENARRERQRVGQEMQARAQAEKRRREAEDATKSAKIAKEAAEAATAQSRVEHEKAKNAAQKALEETKKAKDDLANGIQPITWPTAEEYVRTLEARQYQDGKFHFAIAGLPGSGKSSLVNAFRGVLNDTPGSAATGLTETTVDIGRYPDSDPQRQFIWYDIPGAGTLAIKDWDYFNKQGLYVFDAIIVLFDNRFTATDIAILRNCARWKIPTFIVRSKSDQQIQNIKDTLINKIEAEETMDDDERDSRLEGVLDTAIADYMSMTRQTVQKGLKEADLEDQQVYMISYKALLSVTKGRKMRNALYLNESVLLADLVKATRDCGCPLHRRSLMIVLETLTIALLG